MPLSWFTHNANSILSVEDAHGATWRGLVMVGCSSAGQVLTANPALAPLLDAPICPGTKLPTLQDLVDQLPGGVKLPPLPSTAKERRR